MSECVVRMEMPKSCPCELAGGYDIPLPCFAGHGIPKRCKEFDECVEKGTKPDWCPFICALPEGHGRLVDADAAVKDIRDEIFECKMDGLKGTPMPTEHLWLMENWIADEDICPTIVPAERSET